MSLVVKGRKLSTNVCVPTFRGQVGPPPENLWFPLWMLNRHVELSWDKYPHLLFYGDVGHGEHLLCPSETIRIFLTGENIAPNWNEADYALTHERIWSDRHWRAPLWRHFYDPGHTHVERDFHVVRNRVDRFCNFIYSNDRAKERIEFFHKLNSRKPVDSGGRVLNNVGGQVADKRAYLARSKFTIAFENESHPGYATEKIIEPLLMGSIPIYWGDAKIEDDFNPDCMINVHNFRNLDEVVERVLEIDASEQMWRQYVTAPIFKNGELPPELTDESYIRFVLRVLESGPRIAMSQRARQRLNVRVRTAKQRANDAISIARNSSARVLKRLFRGRLNTEAYLGD